MIINEEVIGLVKETIESVKTTNSKDILIQDCADKLSIDIAIVRQIAEEYLTDEIFTK
jgi:hypothetical protein